MLIKLEYFFFCTNKKQKTKLNILLLIKNLVQKEKIKNMKFIFKQSYGLIVFLPTYFLNCVNLTPSLLCAMLAPHLASYSTFC